MNSCDLKVHLKLLRLQGVTFRRLKVLEQRRRTLGILSRGNIISSLCALCNRNLEMDYSYVMKI